MAWEFISKRYFPKADINTLYFSDFEDIMINKFGSAYIVLKTFDITQSPGKADEIKAIKEEFAERMETFLMETKDCPINPRIRKLVEACYKKGMSFDWTHREHADKFYKQMSIAKHLGNHRLES